MGGAPLRREAGRERGGVRLSLEPGSGDERQFHRRHRDGARRDRRRQPVLSDFRAGPAGRLRRSAPRRERQSHRRRLLEAGFSRRDQERRRHPAEREFRDQGLGCRKPSFRTTPSSSRSGKRASLATFPRKRMRAATGIKAGASRMPSCDRMSWALARRLARRKPKGVTELPQSRG